MVEASGWPGHQHNLYLCRWHEAESWRSLLLQPSSRGIDVYDGRLATLRIRIVLPLALSQNYDALVGDGNDNILIAITGANRNGIAIVYLSSLSDPARLLYLKNYVEMAHAAGLNERPSLRSALGNQANGTAVPPIVHRSVIKHAIDEIMVRHR